jgi:hypothetical protein
MYRRYALFVLAALLLLAGCMEKNAVDIGEKMRMTGITSINVDGKGTDEASLYEFTPINIVPSDATSGSVLVRKYMFVYPIEYGVETNGTVKTSDIAKYVNSSYAYLNSTKEKCKISLEACSTPATCKAACNISACKGVKLNDIGYVLKDLAGLINEKKAITDELSKELKNYNETNATDNAAELFVRAETVDAAISVHPAVAVMGICPKATSAETAIPHFTVSTTKYKLIIIYNIMGSALKRSATVSLQDSIPAELSNRLTLSDVMDSARYATEPNIQVKFNDAEINNSNAEYLVYAMESTAENSQLTYVAMNKGKIDITFMTSGAMDLEGPLSELNLFFVPINAAAGMPRMSLVLAIAVDYVLLLILFQVGSAAYAALLAMATKRDAKTAALESLGSSNPMWIESLALCIVLFVAGAYLETSSARAPIASLDGRSIYEVVPIEDVAALLTIVIYLFGAYLAVDVLMDRLKAVVGGKYYSRNVLRYSAAEIEKGMKELKDNIRRAFQEIGEFSDRGINTNDEYRKIAAISLDGLDTMLKKGETREAYGAIEDYNKTIAESLLIVKNKERTATINEEKWIGMLKDELKESESEKVNIDMLIGIPAEWRLWLVSKFIDENKEDGWVLEDKTLKRSELPETERIATFMRGLAKEGGIMSGAVFNRTVYAGGYFSFGKESVNLAVGGRIIRFLLSLGQTMDKTKNISFSSYGKACNIYVKGKNGISVMLVSSKKIDDSIDGIVEKAIRMVGR